MALEGYKKGSAELDDYERKWQESERDPSRTVCCYPKAQVSLVQ
jgi:hypothetical protein